MELIELKLSVTNCFLIKTKKQYVLVDTGYEEDWELFCKRLKEINVNIAEISHIILTHHHDDHCGLVNKILERNNDIKIVMHNLTKELISVGMNDQNHGGGLINKRMKFLIGFKQFYISVILRKHIDKNNNLKFPPYKGRSSDIIVQNEVRLSEIGIELEGRIVETPGHTIDSISILFDDGYCIVGDAAANFFQFAGTKYCVVFVNDLDVYYKSWGKLIAMNALKIYPAHGKPFGIDKLKKNIGKNKKENMVMIQ
ncbi:MAG: MBL fold metallo-hydrolase [Brevinematales bacterium]|jgi:glyoxylase-like metal-dependent hydrolase (beta-lactamase superfamily II)